MQTGLPSDVTYGSVVSLNDSEFIVASQTCRLDIQQLQTCRLGIQQLQIHCDNINEEEDDDDKKQEEKQNDDDDDKEQLDCMFFYIFLYIFIYFYNI